MWKPFITDMMWMMTMTALFCSCWFKQIRLIHNCHTPRFDLFLSLEPVSVRTFYMLWHSCLLVQVTFVQHLEIFSFEWSNKPSVFFLGRLLFVIVKSALECDTIFSYCEWRFPRMAAQCVQKKQITGYFLYPDKEIKWLLPKFFPPS